MFIEPIAFMMAIVFCVTYGFFVGGISTIYILTFLGGSNDDESD